MSESLSKFGVPLGGGSGRGGLLHLKAKYKFRVRVINFGPVAGGLELSQQVQNVGKPKVNTTVVPVHSYNSIGYYAGKHEWQSIELVVKDDVTNAVSRLVGHQLQKQMNHIEQTSFMAGINYKFGMLIEIMDGGNDAILESWQLEGCFLEAADYSDLNYEDSQFQTINMTVRYDNAIQLGGLMPSMPESIAGIRL